jgi:hypothetical protein
VPLGTRSYPLAKTPRVNAVDLWTLGGVTDAFEDRCLPRICSSNNEDSELEVDGGKILLCEHGVEVCKIKD